jgi:hypothetical protein
MLLPLRDSVDFTLHTFAVKTRRIVRTAQMTFLRKRPNCFIAVSLNTMLRLRISILR